MMKKLAEEAIEREKSDTNPSTTKAVTLSQLKRRNDILEKRKAEENAKKEEESRIKA